MLGNPRTHTLSHTDLPIPFGPPERQVWQLLQSLSAEQDQLIQQQWESQSPAYITKHISHSAPLFSTYLLFSRLGDDWRVRASFSFLPAFFRESERITEKCLHVLGANNGVTLDSVCSSYELQGYIPTNERDVHQAGFTNMGNATCLSWVKVTCWLLKPLLN